MRLRLTVDLDIGRPKFTDDQGKEINGYSAFYWRDWIKSLIGNDRASTILRSAGKIDHIDSSAFYPVKIFCPTCEQDVELVRKSVCWTEHQVIHYPNGYVTLDDTDDDNASIQSDARYEKPYVCPYCGHEFFKSIEEVQEWFNKDRQQVRKDYGING